MTIQTSLNSGVLSPDMTEALDPGRDDRSAHCDSSDCVGSSSSYAISLDLAWFQNFERIEERSECTEERVVSIEPGVDLLRTCDEIARRPE